MVFARLRLAARNLRSLRETCARCAKLALAARNLRSLRATCIEPARALDLDHVGACVREQRGAQRPGPERGEVEHARRAERITARPAFCRREPRRGARRRGCGGRERETEPARALGEPRERSARELAIGDVPARLAGCLYLEPRGQ